MNGSLSVSLSRFLSGCSSFVSWRIEISCCVLDFVCIEMLWVFLSPPVVRDFVLREASVHACIVHHVRLYCCFL
jgi:hypothetical protein